MVYKLLHWQEWVDITLAGMVYITLAGMVYITLAGMFINNVALAAAVALLM